MDINEASQKLKAAGLISRLVTDTSLVGGTHKTYAGNIGVVEGAFFVGVGNNCVKIEIYKPSLEEAVQFLIDNVKPGISGITSEK